MLLLRLLLAILALGFSASAASAQNWPRFRGENGAGVASESKNLPIEFGPDKNLAWKTEIAPGASSPVIWEGKIFITSYQEEGGAKLGIVQAFDLANGKPLWKQTKKLDRAEKKSRPNDPASSTPAVDASGLYVLFSGFGLIGYSHDGAERWTRPLEPFNQPHGMAASPIVEEGLVILVADQCSKSFIVAYDAACGEPKWKTDRPSFVGGYATPVRLGDCIVTSGPLEVRAYDLFSGAQKWSYPNVGVMPVSSPIVAGGRFYAYNDAVPPYEQLVERFEADKNGDGKIAPDEFPDPAFHDAVISIDKSYGNGDGALTDAEWNKALRLLEGMNTFVSLDVQPSESGAAETPKIIERWRNTKLLTDSASILHSDGLLYLIQNGGILSTVDPESGEVLRRGRVDGLSGLVYASPVAANGKIYFLDNSGAAVVIGAGRDWKVIAKNHLNEPCFATPAISRNTLVIRGEKTLFAFRQR